VEKNSPVEVMMARPLVVFEDEGFSNLFPLTLTRPVFDLVCGMSSLAGKVVAALGAGAGAARETVWWRDPGSDPVVRFHLRDYLASGRDSAVTSYRDLLKRYDMLTLINGRVVFRSDLLDGIQSAWQGKYVCGGSTVVANLSRDRVDDLEQHVGRPLPEAFFAGLPERDLEVDMVSYPWDLVRLNAREISTDFVALGGSSIESEPSPMAHMVGSENIRIGRGVRVSPGVVIDAVKGPVSIADGAVVMPNASLEGPIHIGRGSTVKMGAKIYGGTTIGPVSKIGGEVAETIVHGNSNKQHEGFLGHSYLGEWTNIGAGTETSDLKNNYSPVRVTVGGRPVDSGELFVGLFMGDHSKTGIGTVFSTGTVVGACCNIFGPDYPPKYMPSFTWGGSIGFEEHDLDKAIMTAARVMARRGQPLGPEAESVLRKVFELTRDERRVFLGR
jgi:UDP-N-acetylglucosamine diphosphorylase/glucosamine-1-phosphate N-acetyltransferase